MVFFSYLCLQYFHSSVVLDMTLVNSERTAGLCVFFPLDNLATGETSPFTFVVISIHLHLL